MRDTRQPRSAMACELLVYAATVAWLLWPVLLHFATRVPGRNDAAYSLWQGWRVGALIRSGGIFSLRIPDVFTPVGVDLRLVDGFGPMLVSACWHLVAGPFAAYNLTLATATALNIAAARHLAVRLGADRLVRILVAVGYATAPCVVTRFTSGHLALMFAFTTPLLIAEAIRTVRDGEPLRFGRVGLLVFASYLCSAYFLAFGCVAFVTTLLVGAASNGRPQFRAACVRLVAALGIAAVLLSPFVWARLRLDATETAGGHRPTAITDSEEHSADALGLLPLVSRQSTGFPGVILLTGLAGLLVVRDRMRRPLLAAALATWTLALGPTLEVAGRPVLTSHGAGVRFMPAQLLASVPGFASLRAPDRASLALAAVLAASCAIALPAIVGGPQARRRRVAAATVVAALALWSGVASAQTIGEQESGQVAAALGEVAQRAGPGDSTLMVPADCFGSDDGLRAMLQIAYGTPSAGCFPSWQAVPWYTGLDSYRDSAALAALRCRQDHLGFAPTAFRDGRFDAARDLPALRGAFGVRFVIVDKQRMRLPECSGFGATADQLRGYRILAEDADWVVIDTRRS